MTAATPAPAGMPAMPAPAAPPPVRVLVVDDQELVRSGFCVILDAADGIAHWREYQDTLGMAISIGQLAALGIPPEVSPGSGVDDGETSESG
jgi:hypothetical protein